MVQEYLGAIKMFAGDFAPTGYAFAQGQTLALNQYTALFSLYGTTYGGNGISTFQLPNLQSQLPISWGNGAGLTPRVIGETGGTDNVTLLSSSVPSHNHVFNGTTNTAGTNVAGSTMLLGKAPVGVFYATAGGTGVTTVALNHGAVQQMGGNLPHNNDQPSMGINFIVCMSGVFPSRG
jgi:microcystin-dependent protein